MKTTISISLVLVLVAVIVLPILAAQKDGRTQLTIEETLGAVFMHETVSDVAPSGGPTVLASANPKARPYLYKLLSHEDIAEYHRNILLMIGYTGDEEDVAALEEWGHNSFEGELGRWEYSSLSALFSALATMSRRGIEPAQSLLGRMATPDYWDERVDFTIPSANAFVNDHPVDALLLYALPAYATSGADDWNAKVSSYLDQIQDEELKEYMSGQLSTELIRAQIKELSETHYPPIPDEVREHLPRMFNGDMENPGRARLPGKAESAEAGVNAAPPPVDRDWQAFAHPAHGSQHGQEAGDWTDLEPGDTEAAMMREFVREALSE